MAKMDQIKELIGFLKAIFVTLIVIDTSLIAWVFKHFDNESSLKLSIVSGLIAILIGVILFLFLKILKEIKKLEEL